MVVFVISMPCSEYYAPFYRTTVYDQDQYKPPGQIIAAGVAYCYF